MSRKLITACMALAAFVAFAVVPAGASANNDPDLTHPTGTMLAAGAKIKATSVGHTLMTDANGGILITCSTAEMTGTLKTNNGSTIAGDIESAHFTGSGAGNDCTSVLGDVKVTTNVGNGTPWCVHSGPNDATDKFTVRGGKCAEEARAMTFALDFTSGITCKYTRETKASPLIGTYTTHPDDAVLSISHEPFHKEEGSFFCPSTGYLDMSFTMETDSATAEPLYIS